MKEIFIADVASYDELYEKVRDDFIDTYGSLEDAMENLGYTFDDEMIIDEIEEAFYYYINRITSPEGLKQYWLENGWTLDRGYGGPNYKERVADNTDWEYLFDFITEVFEVDEIFNAIMLTPVQLNDLVIFSEDWMPEDEEDDL